MILPTLSKKVPKTVEQQMYMPKLMWEMIKTVNFRKRCCFLQQQQKKQE